MSVDKLVDSSQLDSDLTSVANAIRAKSGGSGQLAFPSGFVSEIGNIPIGPNEKLLGSGTYTVTSAQSSVVIETSVSSSKNGTVSFLVKKDEISSDVGQMLWWAATTKENSHSELTEIGASPFPNAEYLYSNGTQYRRCNYQDLTINVGQSPYSIGYWANSSKKITIRQYNNSYKIQPGTYSWYVWGEEETT